MILADLLNDLSLEMRQIHHDLSRQSTYLTFILTPTLGTTVQQQTELYKEYQIEYNKRDGSPEQGVIFDLLVDRSPLEIINLLKTSYTEYIALTQVEKDEYDAQFKMLFDYVESVGIKP